jgi:hypothetical protein
MAAPTPTPRVTPTGKYLDDGHQTLVTFARDTNVNLWEKSVTPPGIDGGDEIDVTTMHNVLWRTTRPRQLQTLTEMTFTAAYDPNIYTQVLALVNQDDTITVTFLDGSTVAFYGYLKSFTPDAATEGEQPEATVVVVPTNWDATNSVEAGPTVTEVAGT